MRVPFAVALLAFAFTFTSAEAADELKAFPPADPGMLRYVINRSPLPDESAARVELIVGKTARVDERNRYFFGGRLQKETIRGWGYDRYILHALGPMAGTRMAVISAPEVDRFVALGGDPYLVRYNSRLPLVVYVPAGVEVRYRLWHADPSATAAE